MLFLSRFLQRFNRNEKQKSDNVDSGVPCIGDKGRPYRCKILLLDDTEYIIDVKTGCKGVILLERVFSQLNLIEKDYFGLRFLDHLQQTQWLDPSKSVVSQIKGLAQYTLYFGVKFYAADPCKLHEEITRYQFFLQVKQDILQGRLPVPFDLASELSSYVVQSELGDYDPKRYSYGYVSEFRFIPNQTEEFENQVMQIHRSLVGQVPATAEYRYLDKVKWLDMYGVDLHPVCGDGGLEYYLCLTPTGVVVYRNKQKISQYFWPRITKITFKARMFMIRVRDKNNDENTFAFECSNKNACKHLWKCCVEHHAFFRLTSANQSYNANGKLFSLGSKYRYSGRTEKQLVTESLNRPAPQVVRTPSKRHQRRNSTGTEPANMPPAMSEVHLAPSDPTATRQRSAVRELGYASAPESPPRSMGTAPWEAHRRAVHGVGLFTCPDSPTTSVRSARLFPGNRRITVESDAESAVSSHRRRHRHRESESENEANHRHRTHRSRCPAETDGSESEAAHRHRNNRKYRRSLENVNGAAAGGGRDANTGMFPIRPNGSLSSMVSEQSAANKRARRRRSRSPGNKQPPAELAQHFKYVDPEAEGLNMEQVRGMDLHFTTVETAGQPVKVSQRHRQRSRDRRSAVSEPPVAVMGLPAGEPPPPYTEPPVAAHHTHRIEETLRSPVSVQMNTTYTAPIVKTKPVAMITPPKLTAQPTKHVIYGSLGNSAVVTCSQQQQQQQLHHMQQQHHQQQQQQQQHHHQQQQQQQQQQHHQQQQQQHHQQQQQHKNYATTQNCERLGNHVRDDSGLGIESPQDSSSPQTTTHDGGYLKCRYSNLPNQPASSSQQTTPTYCKPSYSEQVSSKPPPASTTARYNKYRHGMFYGSHSDKTTQL